MNKKILLGIVGVLAALIVVVSVVMLTRPQPESTPPEAEIFAVTPIYPDYETIRIIATVKNLESYKIEVTLRFTVLRDGEIQQSATKSLVLNAKDTQNTNMELPYNFHLDTGYDCEIVSVTKK